MARWGDTGQQVGQNSGQRAAALIQRGIRGAGKIGSEAAQGASRGISGALESYAGLTPEEAEGVKQAAFKGSAGAAQALSQVFGRIGAPLAAGAAQVASNIREGKAAQGADRSPFVAAVKSVTAPRIATGTDIVSAAKGSPVRSVMEPGISLGEMAKRGAQTAAGLAFDIKSNPLNAIGAGPMSAARVAEEKAAEAVPTLAGKGSPILQQAERAAEMSARPQALKIAEHTARRYKSLARAETRGAYVDLQRIMSGMKPEEASILASAVESPAVGKDLVEEIAKNHHAILGREATPEFLGAIERKRDLIRQLNSRAAEGELARGLIQNVRKNYMLHALPEETMEAVRDNTRFLRFQGSIGSGGTLPFAKQRTLEGAIDEINDAAGREVFSKDTADLMSRRLSTSSRKKAISDYHTEMFRMFGRPVTEANAFQAQKTLKPGEVLVAVPGTLKSAATASLRSPEAMKQQMDKLTLAFNSEPIFGTYLTKTPPQLEKELARSISRGGIKYFAMPEKIAQEVANFTNRAGSPEFASDFLGALRSGQDLWKAWTLLPFPSYQFQNFIGNKYNRYINYEGAADQAANTSKALAILLPEEAGRHGVGMIAVGDMKMPPAAWAREATEAGVLRSGQFGVTARTTISPKDILKRRLEPGDVLSPRRQPLVRAGAVVGRTVEDSDRLGHYLFWRGQGYSPRMAAEQVKKALFNADELGKTDEAIRNLLPFWSWTRNNVPFQLKALATRPGRKVPEFAAITEATKQAGIPQTKNKYMIQQEGVPFQQTPEENRYTNFWRRLPGGDIAPLFIAPDVLGDKSLTDRALATAQQALRQVGGMVTPFAARPLEAVFNQQLYSGQEIQKFPGQKREMFGVPIDVRLAHLLGAARIVTESNRIMESEKQKKARGEAGPEWLRTLTGIRSLADRPEVSRRFEKIGLRGERKDLLIQRRNQLRAFRDGKQSKAVTDANLKAIEDALGRLQGSAQ